MKDRMTLLIAMMLHRVGRRSVRRKRSHFTHAGDPGHPAPAKFAAEVRRPRWRLKRRRPRPRARPRLAPSACEEFFGFCVTASVSGSVIGMGTAGVGSSSKQRLRGLGRGR